MTVRAFACLAVVTGCTTLAGDPVDETTATQELNGDTWTDADDNPYTSGAGAENYGIAISPVSHKILVAGDRLESDGTPTWIVRGSPAGSSTFGLNSTFKLAAGKTSEAVDVAVDAKGVWYVVGDAADANGDFHWIVRRSDDDGATWQTVFNAAMDGHPSHIAVDAAYNVFVTGSMVTPSGGRAIVLRGASQGATWAGVLSYQPTAYDASASGVCSRNFIGATHVFVVTTVFDSPATSHVEVLHSGNGGNLWQVAFTTQSLAETFGFGCAGVPSSSVFFALGANDTMGSSQWDTATVSSFVPPWVLQHDAVNSASGETQDAFAVANVGARIYTVGRYDGPGQHWHVRMRVGSTWMDSDDYIGPGTIALSEATSLAYDETRGLYVAGKAYDDTGRLHGIVRHRK